MHIWRMGIDGSDPRQLTSGSGENTPDWSPDDKWIVYQAIGPDRLSLWKIPASGGNPVLLSNKNPMFPAVSPDGKLIAFTYLYDRHDAIPAGIAIVPADGGAPVQILDPGTFNARVRWTTDSKALIYSKEERGVANIYLQHLAGGPPRRLTDFKTSSISSFDWSWTSRQLAITRGTESNDVA
jgi:Tol biopolymer transport system component